MNKAKYIIGVILIIGGFLFTGELFIWHLDNFQESYYRASFSIGDEVPKGYTNKDIVDDFLQTGESCEVDFFTVRDTFTSDIKKSITIYGTERAITYLKEHHIVEGIYTSLYAGNTDLSYKAFSDIENIDTMRNLYLLGTEESIKKMHAFKARLIGKYGGGFPHLYGSDRSTYMNLAFVWGLIYTLLLLLTSYEVIAKKKEILIRLTFGEDLRNLFFRSILKDTLVFTVIFSIVFWIMTASSNIQFLAQYIVFLFCIFLILNIGMHALLFRINLKKDLSNTKGSKNLLIANTTIKIITAMVAILLLAGNFMILAIGYNYYKQREFFEDHSEYDYYWLNYKMLNNIGKEYKDTHLMHQRVYQQFQDRAVQYIDLSESLNMDYPLILINYTAKNELLTSNEKFHFLPKEIDEKIYIFSPNTIIDNTEIGNRVIEICDSYLNIQYKLDSQFSREYELRSYSDHIEVIGIHDAVHLYRSKLIKDPIIILNNSHQIIDERSARPQMYYAYHVLYSLTDKEFDAVVEEYQLEDQIVKRTNALEFYEHNWTIIKRAAKLAFSLSIFLLALELILILLILKMEYKMHSVEISLKKVLGYTLFARNRQVIILSLCTSLFSVFAAGIVTLVFHLQEGMYVVTAGLLVFSIEALYIYYKINTIEKMKIATILKGEGI